MPIVGKQFYTCPPESFSHLGGTSFRPAIASAVDSNGGAWAISETVVSPGPIPPAGQPLAYTVVVNDRLSPALPHNAAVHTAIPAQVASALAIGPDLATAQASAIALVVGGTARAANMVNQIVGGE